MYYLKIALRNLLRNGLYSWINVVGLAVSMAAVLLILIWVNDEMSFDRFHSRNNDIYVTVANFYQGEKQGYWDLTSPPLAAAAIREIPEVENACRILRYWDAMYLQHEEHTLNDIKCCLVDSSFFSILDFKVIDGDISSILTDEHSVVLSASAARTLFGDDNPIGKTVTDDEQRKFHVTGIFADMPQNSSNRYNVIFSFRMYELMKPNLNEWWGNLNYKTYFMLAPGADANAVAQKLTDIHRRNSEWKLTYLLHPLLKENLYNLDGSANSKLQACRLFTVAVAALLLIACINYVNLVTARASRRNKEIFVRNVLGARRRNLFAHFFNESLMLFFLSLVGAALLTYLLFPVYSQITGKDIDYSLFSTSTLALYGATFVLTSLFAGVYPALSLSLKLGLRSAAGAFLRRTLVVLQFAASVVLILGAFVINRQMDFIRTKNPGYDCEHVFYFGIPKEMQDLAGVKSRLKQVAGIEGVTLISQPVNDIRQFYAGTTWEGKPDDKKINFTVLYTDSDFIPMMNIRMSEGNNFTGMPADSAYFIVNRAAVEAMGMENPVGKRMEAMMINGTIIGVTEDFHFQNMRENIKPLMIAIRQWRNYIYVKASAGNITAALNAAEEVYREYNSIVPFDYSFVDDDFDRIYKTDIRTGRLFNAFAVIAILVSCLGLFGLITFTAESKRKEIGIRKVFGASVAGIVKMLSLEFLILIGIAMLIAFPLAYFWLDRMLQDYAYRIDITWWMFALAAGLTIILTLLTVGWQALKAATANPAKAIEN